MTLDQLDRNRRVRWITSACRMSR